jgi:hypothetical protein
MRKLFGFDAFAPADPEPAPAEAAEMAGIRRPPATCRLRV